MKESKVDDLWRKLKIIYEQPTAQNKVNMMKRLVNLKYKEGYNITEHTREFKDFVDQLTTIKIILDDELHALLLLSSLLDSWEILEVLANNSALNGKLTLEWLQIVCKMKNIEARILKWFPLSQMHLF